MTVRDLLLHTSGLNHRTSEIYRREQVRTRTMTMAQFIANLVRVPLMEDPGTRYRYSEATTVLGRLVEIWSGKPFEVFLEERIFRPLRMTDTMFWAATPEQRARLTTVYGPAPGGGLTKVETRRCRSPSVRRSSRAPSACCRPCPTTCASARCCSTKGELDGVRLLSAKTVETMTANGLSDGRAEDARRIDGLGPGEREGCAESERRPTRRAAANTGGTARPARSSGSIPARRW